MSPNQRSRSAARRPEITAVQLAGSATRRRESVEERGGRNGAPGVGGEGDQGAVVVEHEDAAARPCGTRPPPRARRECAARVRPAARGRRRPAASAARNRSPHAKTSLCTTRSWSGRMRSRRSSSSSRKARSITSAVRSSSMGLTRKASPISAAAPANSLSTSTPLPSGLQAQYSFATRFMPSRSGVTQPISADRRREPAVRFVPGCD